MIDWDSGEEARIKAFSLIEEIVPAPTWNNFVGTGILTCEGKKYNYLLRIGSQTEIQYKNKAKLKAWACMMLTIPAPDCDRLIAEYLLIINDEARYWREANISGEVMTFEEEAGGGWIYLSLGCLIIALSVNLLRILLK